MDLRFLRDTDGREVDFVVLEDRKPLFAVEVKTGTRDVVIDGVRVLPLFALCREVGIP